MSISEATTASMAAAAGLAATNSAAAAAGKRKLPSLPQIGRSYSLGRNLPPIPSKPPTLVRRRTFDEDYRTDWI